MRIRQLIDKYFDFVMLGIALILWYPISLKSSYFHDDYVFKVFFDNALFGLLYDMVEDPYPSNLLGNGYEFLFSNRWFSWVEMVQHPLTSFVNGFKICTWLYILICSYKIAKQLHWILVHSKTNKTN